ncbi:hypothetical protein LCGC14_0389890 [marine sediment metagenome]|uniref:J domain-containing protein n=1 Tax=marine sediment metagenome TaxID=412755 RepID=A0A0F9THT3_9ZZZZ
MNRAEALKILGLQASATEKEIKKKFKKLAFEKHPDRNNNPSADEEFKKISSAFDCLMNPQPQRQQFHGPPINLRDFFGGHTIFRPKPINVSVSITFKESVLGCKKKLSFNRDGPCEECGGRGHEPCEICMGAGFDEVMTKHGNMIFCQRTICDTCNGLGHNGTVCSECSGNRSQKEHINVDVTIPGGVHNGQIIKLRGGGNVVVVSNSIAHGDVFLKTTVASDQDMRIVGRDVISNIELSLYDALQGVKKKVRTVKGNTTLMIEKGSRHKDQIKLSGYGVEGKGDHIFTVEVSYPKNTDKLIEFLENKE